MFPLTPAGCQSLPGRVYRQRSRQPALAAAFHSLRPRPSHTNISHGLALAKQFYTYERTMQQRTNFGQTGSYLQVATHMVWCSLING